MDALHQNYKRVISLKQAKRMIILLVLVFLFDFLFFSLPVMASEMPVEAETGGEQAVLTDLYVVDEPVIINNLPENNNRNVKWSGYYTITAYNSEAGQCDNSPCITANGFNLCEHNIEDTIAVNFLRFGTKVKIPDLFGDKVFIVRDRMNEKYSDRLDVWMIEKQDAKQFGVKIAKIEVLE